MAVEIIDNNFRIVTHIWAKRNTRNNLYYGQK